MSDHPGGPTRDGIDAADQALDQRLRWAAREVQASFERLPMTGQLVTTRRQLRRRAWLRAGLAVAATVAAMLVVVASGLYIRAGQSHPAANHPSTTTTAPETASQSPQAVTGDLLATPGRWTRHGSAPYQSRLVLTAAGGRKMVFPSVQPQDGRFAVTSTGCPQTPATHCEIVLRYLGFGKPPATSVTIYGDAGMGSILIPGLQ